MTNLLSVLLNCVQHPVYSSYVFDVFQDEYNFFLPKIFCGIVAMSSMILLMVNSIKCVNK